MATSVVVSCFDASQRHFACVSSDRKLKIWDTATNTLVNEYRESHQSTHHYTAIAWLPPTKGSPQGSVALGCDDGSMAVCDLTNGEWKVIGAQSTPASQQRHRAHAASVTSLAYSGDHQSLWSAAMDGTVQQHAWPSLALLSSRQSPANQSIQHLAVRHQHSDELLLATQSSVEVLDLTKKEWAVKKKFSGSAGAIETISQSGDGALVCVTTNDRYVPLWSLDGAKKSRKSVATLSLSAPVQQAKISETVSEGVYEIAALVDNQSVNVFTFSLSSSSLSSTPLTTLSLPPAPVNESLIKRQQTSLANDVRRQQLNERANHSADGGKKKRKNSALSLAGSTNLATEVSAYHSELILNFAFVTDKKSPSSMLMVRGHRDRPQCSIVQYKSSDYLGSVQLPVLRKSMLIDDSTSNSEDGAKKRKSEINAGSSSAPLSSTAKLASPSLSAFNSVTQSPSLSSTLPLMQRTLAERLAEMNKNAGTFAGDTRVLSTGSANDSLAMPKAGSIQSLLTQALHTNDDTLFEFCLQAATANTPTPTVTNISLSLSQSQPQSQPVTGNSQLELTLSRLPSSFVFPLLSRLTSLLKSRPSRAVLLLTWIHALLLIHTPHLLSLNPQSLSAALSPLIELIDNRAASYKKMCRLQGKLELLKAQIKQSTSAGSSSGSDSVRGGEKRRGPMKVFIEGVGLINNPNTIEAATTANDSDKTAASAKKSRRRRGRDQVAAPVEAETAMEDEDMPTGPSDCHGALMNGFSDLNDDDDSD